MVGPGQVTEQCSLSFFICQMGSFTFSAGLLRSLETFQVELLEQNLEHSKCLKTATHPPTRHCYQRGILPPNIWKPLLALPPPGNVTQAPLMASQMAAPLWVAVEPPPLAPVWAENGTRQQGSWPLPSHGHICCPTSGRQGMPPIEAEQLHLTKNKRPPPSPAPLLDLLPPPPLSPKQPGSLGPLAAVPPSCLAAFVQHVNFPVSRAPCTGSNQGS